MLREQASEIRKKQRFFYFQDECHLVWGDACGYVWGSRGSRTFIPMVNERIRQTYFGVLNILSGRVWIKPYSTANSLNSEDFLKHLLQRNPGKKITVCWDKVSYHDSKRIKRFVRDINKGLSKKHRRLTIVWLPLAAPEENPMEDVWLYGKTAIRKDPEGLLSFGGVKQRFEKALKNHKFIFEKLQKFKKILQLI